MQDHELIARLECYQCSRKALYLDKGLHVWCSSCESYQGFWGADGVQPSLFLPRWPGDWFGRAAQSW